MRVTPSRYRCRTHDQDLTSDVLGKINNDDLVMANLGWRQTPSGMVQVATFEVDVRCPKGDSNGHVLRFKGSYEK